MKIGILQTGHTPADMADIAPDYALLFRAMLGEDSFDYQTWNVVDGDFPDTIDAADGYIITGSRHGAYEDHPWIAPLEDLIRQIYAAKKPMFGACFGHQIIAQALGGKVEKFKDGWSVGLQTYDFGDQTLDLNAWHQDQVVQLPPEARVVASSPFCKYAALAWGDHVFTTQAHPEFQSDFIQGLIEYRGKGVVPDALLNSATDHLAKRNDNAQIASKVTRLMRGEGIS